MSLIVLILHSGFCLTTVVLLGRQGPDGDAAVCTLFKEDGLFGGVSENASLLLL